QRLPPGAFCGGGGRFVLEIQTLGTRSNEAFVESLQVIWTPFPGGLNLLGELATHLAKQYFHFLLVYHAHVPKCCGCASTVSKWLWSRGEKGRMRPRRTMVDWWE
ncbi:unnamed protein product, partial [Pylaiella littoralis]